MTKLVVVDSKELLYTVYSGKTKVVRLKAEEPLTKIQIEELRQGVLEFDEVPPESA